MSRADRHPDNRLTSSSGGPTLADAGQASAERPRITSPRETLRQLLRTAHPHRAAFARSLWMLVAAASLQGLAMSCLIPIFRALLPMPPLPPGIVPVPAPDVTTRAGDAAAPLAFEGPAAPHAMPDGFSQVGLAPDWAAALPWLGLFTVLTLAVQLLRWQAQGFDYNGLMADAIHSLRTRLGEQLRRMPLLRLQEKRTGEMSAVLLGHVDENLNYTLMVCSIVINAILIPLSAALGTLFWDWRLAAGILLIFPAILPLYRWRRPQFQRVIRELAVAHARCNGDILEYTQGLPVLRASRCTGVHARQLHQSVLALEALQVESQRKGIKPGLIIATVTEAGMLLVMAAGLTWVTQGSLDPAILAAVTVMLVRFGEPLSVFIGISAIFELIETALKQIDEVLAIAPLPRQEPAQVPERFDIRFEDVHFGYEAPAATSATTGIDRPANTVLRGLSAHLPARGLTALVGSSGCGKTTLTRLLMRHADPQAGRITIGGVDVRAIEPETLNRLISVVFQDVHLFDDTVLNNIRMARPDASDEAVRDAARKAHCLDFIDALPRGWQTRLGETGGKLSGGERQRISIARALLKDAPIVILDEPTAALDTESERAVQQAIETLVQDRTVIVITHRLSTIAGAGQILVIDDGQVAERGTHSELLARNGRYAQLWDAQQQAKPWRAGQV
ncbi:MAG: ABC transporter ATP-binding protein [Lautropia sp.]|nr:ABC transporter ATP-binding protein [Lautropia sp.]